MTWPDQLSTPAVVVDLDVLDRNIAAMARRSHNLGVGLRPHTKTSKCIPIIERQVAAGATGLTVATLGEAEVLADAGFDDLFQAYPLWAGRPQVAGRLRELLERVRYSVGVDSVAGAAALGEAMRGANHRLDVVIEIDSGMHRSGVDVDDGLRQVALAAERAGLHVVGAFTFPGHAYASREAPASAAASEAQTLADAGDVLSTAGFDVSVLSAGSSPTMPVTAGAPITEQRPGSYVFNDRQQIELGAAAYGDVALTVAATVVSVHRDGRFVLDAGSKVLASDRPTWLAGHGHIVGYPDAEIRSLSEHHAVAWVGSTPPPIGSIVSVIPNHCCVVVNLVDELIVVGDGELVDLWPVAARGRNN